MVGGRGREDNVVDDWGRDAVALDGLKDTTRGMDAAEGSRSRISVEENNNRAELLEGRDLGI